MLAENFILIDNVTEANIETVLSNLANLYSNTGFTDEIELFKDSISNRKFLVTFKNSPDFDRFAYFVNYMHYPEGFESWESVVNGFYQIGPNEIAKDFKSGEWLQLYVSKSDTGYDNVSIINAFNESFLFDFGGKTKSLAHNEKTFLLPSIDKSNYSLVKIIIPTVKPQADNKPWWKIW